jgi:alpha-L-fucosidase
MAIADKNKYKKMMWMKKPCLCFLLLAMLNFSVSAQEKISGAPSTKWFEDAKFGLFLHFGLFSLPAGEWEGKRYHGISEWIEKRAKIPLATYRAMAKDFNPDKFNADEWVRFAKASGFRYIVITAKHHEGFAMFDSKVSDFTITKASPFKRDVLKELADACKTHGMKLGFYYSQTQDWNEYDAVGNDWEWPKDRKRNFQKYLDEKCKPQLKELLTRYGDVAVIWFDTPDGTTREESQQLVDWVRQFQPNCLTSSRVGNDLGDYLALRDHELPTRIINRPFEALFTHNDSWGYSTVDRNFRSPKEILRLLIESNTKGGNLIFNMGPTSSGTFQSESTRDLQVVGKWLQRNGEAVYGTKASPLAPLSWGGCTGRPGELFLHVFEWPVNGVLKVPTGKFTPTSITINGNAKPLAYSFKGDDLIIKVPLQAPDPLNTVVKVTYKGMLSPPTAPTLSSDLPTTLIPEISEQAGRAKIDKARWMEEFGDWHHATFISGWMDSTDIVRWKLRVSEADRYWVVLDYSFDSDNRPAEGVITVAGQQLFFPTLPTGDKVQHFREHRIGMVQFSQQGSYELSMKPIAAPGGFVNLRGVTLIPYR